MATVRYPWQRRWILEGDSLASRIGNYPWDSYSKPGLLFDEISHVPCLILLGEPAIGKTTAMKEAQRHESATEHEREPISVWKDLGDYSSDSYLKEKVFEDQEILKWRNFDAAKQPVLYLYLDALDEAKLLIGAIVGVIKNELNELRPFTNLRLRITCRLVDWPDTLDKDLSDFWGAEAVKRCYLLPLNQEDISIAATQNQIDPTAFLEAVRKEGATTFAQRPITLRPLLHAYKEEGQLSSSQTKLYEKNCRMLCTELNPGRLDAGFAGMFSKLERLETAACIAYLTKFAGRTAIWTHPDSSDAPFGCLRKDDLSAFSSNFDVLAPARVSEALNTGLFTSRGSSILTWSHRTYEDFLAAWCVTQKFKLSNESLLSLMIDESGRITPQLRTLASWLASLRPSLFDKFLLNDVTSLLTVDPSILDDDTRSQLAEHLLNHFEDIDAEYDRQRLQVDAVDRLVHPGLVEQLRAYIVDTGVSVSARKAAIDIAGKARLHALIDDLHQVATSNAAESVRIEAVSSLADMPLEAAGDHLKQFVVDDTIEDPSDELKGIALPKLWPNHLSAQELFDALRPPQRPNLIGMYAYFLRGNFVDGLGDGDLVSALNWIRKQPTFEYEAQNPFAEANDRILVRSWDTLEEPGVLALFAEVASSRLYNSRPIVGRESRLIYNDQEVLSLPSRLATEHDRRRWVLTEVLNRYLDVDRTFLLRATDTPLCTTEDFDWLLGFIVDWSSLDNNDEETRALIALALHTFDFNQPEHLGSLFTAIEKAPALLEAFHPKLFVPFESPVASYSREEKSRANQNQKFWVDKRDAQRLGIEACLKKIEDGHVNEFVRLWNWLQQDANRPRPNDLWDVNLARTKAWATASSSTQAAIKRAALAYLDEFAPDTTTWFEEWVSEGMTYFAAYAAISALCLLAEVDREAFHSIDHSVWGRWAPFIAAYPTSSDNDSTFQEIFSLAFDKASSPTVSALEELIKRDDRVSGNAYSLQRFRGFWNAEMEGVLYSLACEEDVAPDTLRSLLLTLYENGSARVGTCAKNLLSNFSQDAALLQKAANVAVILMLRESDASWSMIWPIIQDDSALAHEIVASAARGFDFVRSINLSDKLTSEQLSEFYILLSERYPPSEDPNHEDESMFSVTDRDEIGYWRWSLLYNLRDRGTTDSVRVLEELVHKLPDQKWLPQVLSDARENLRRSEWSSPEPEHLLALLSNSENRLVYNGAQLLAVLEESIARLQGKLQGETPSARFLWNNWRLGKQKPIKWRPKEENDLSDYVKSHLELDLVQRGVVLNREVQIRRKTGAEPGQQTDIHVNAISKEGDVITAIIEVKGNWHRDVRSAMKDQLSDRYLNQSQTRFGVYLVGWYSCESWDESDNRKKAADRHFASIQDAETYFRTQSEDITDFTVRPVVLDCTI